MGIPLFNIVDKIKDKDIILIEASSYMLEATYLFKPNIYTITNLSINHLDHHLTKEAYFESKLQIISRMNKDDIVIFNNSNIDTLSVRQVINISDDLLNEYTSFDRINIKVAITNLFYIFEYLNYPFSYEDVIDKSKLLEKEQFRFQTVYKDQFLKIINDSKSTNVISGYNALKESLKEKEDLYLIMGGKNNKQDFSVIYPLLNSLKIIYLYGENKDILYDKFKLYNKSIIKCNKLDEVIRLITYKKGIILFSPMSQSLDQFKDFIDRGNCFNKLILKILYN